MKKRFTVMLDINTIAKIKQLGRWYTPTAIRQDLESLIDDYATDEIFRHDFNESKGRYQFDDK